MHWLGWNVNRVALYFVTGNSVCVVYFFTLISLNYEETEKSVHCPIKGRVNTCPQYMCRKFLESIVLLMGHALQDVLDDYILFKLFKNKNILLLLKVVSISCVYLKISMIHWIFFNHRCMHYKNLNIFVQKLLPIHILNAVVV